MKIKHALYVIVALAIPACGGSQVKDSTVKTNDINEIDPDAWQHLAEKRIFFGHQSVGGNIVEGVERLMQEHPQIHLNVKVAASAQDVDGPMFAHSAIGKNRDPQSKIADFADKMDAGLGTDVDIALMKFCYVDISGDTDVNAMFDEYTKTMDELERKYPNVTFVHSTVPLQVASSPLKDRIKKMIGKPRYQHEANINRNRFNQLLSEKYQGNSPVFDLAGYESIVGPGKRAAFKQDGDTYLTLNPAYSSDGSHLNATGQVAMATEFLVFLQSLDEK